MEFTQQGTQESNGETPTKKLFSFHGLLGNPQNHYQTPPPRVARVNNPFEHVLREHLGKNFISPSVFIKKTPVKEFKWTIDELAVIKPAEIDENSSNQFESPDRDDHYDSITQSRIDSYFSMQQILPSPMQPYEQISLIKNDHDPNLHSPTSTTTSGVPQFVQTVSSYAQTTLTLPPKLPEEVERILKPFFTFTQDQSQQHVGCVIREDELYKQLFDDLRSPQIVLEENDTRESGGIDWMENISSPARRSSGYNYKHSSLYQRTIGTPGNFNEMNLCNLSPIQLPLVEVEEKDSPDEQACEFQNSSQVMSIDGSFNVPDCSNVETFNNSQLDSSHHSSEALSTSTINWDLEYKQMSSPLPRSSKENSEAMEMSRLNTPKQRTVPSQRKKLSASFINDHQSDDEDLMAMSQQSIKDGGESGYCTTNSFNEQGFPTFSSSTSSSSAKFTNSWETVDVVSSTPTKRKQCFL